MVDKHRGVRLLEQDMKVYEKSLEKKLKDIVTIDDKQFALQSCKSTVDANFVLRQLQEKFGTKELFLVFVDLQKALYRVPKEAIQWALRCQQVS